MSKKLFALVLSLSMVMTMLLAGCTSKPDADNSTPPADSTKPGSEASQPVDNNGGEAKGRVYWLNFKPESDEVLNNVAKMYTEKTGVPVKIVTAASGTYSQTLNAEMGKSEAPTIFNVGNQAGVRDWTDYALDLTGTPIANELNTDAYNLYDENGKLVLPLAELEGGGEFSGSFVDEWTIEATPELTDALEQLLQENSDPRTAGDILSKLEQELDCQLFRRTSQGLELTESGAALQLRARRILEEEGRSAVSSRPPEPPAYPDASRIPGGGGARAYQGKEKRDWRGPASILLWALAILCALGALGRWIARDRWGSRAADTTDVVLEESLPAPHPPQASHAVGNVVPVSQLQLHPFASLSTRRAHRAAR